MVKMKKKTTKAKASSKKKKKNNHHHPIFTEELTIGQRAADAIATFGGSWTFILSFLAFIVFWMVLNTIILTTNSFDNFPFILLNLTLSCLAAIQAPIILMAQNRQAERDRIDAKYDHQINRKAEREVQDIQRDLEEIKKMLQKISRKK